jgi:serine protease Do
MSSAEEQIMNGLRTAAVIAAAIGVASAGLALSPAVHGQARVVQAPRIVDVVLGGSRIGISIQDVEAADAAKREGVTGGVLVEEVSPESPAEQAGIRKGDLIVEFDGERVRSTRQFTRLVHETPAGRSVPAVVLREGQRTPLMVTPGEAERPRIQGLEDLGALMEDLRSRVIIRAPTRPAPPPPPSPPAWSRSPDDPIGRTNRLGITPGALSPQLAEYFGATEGVLVTSVADGSVAQKAGIRAGDVVTAVNGTSVRAPADLRRRLQELREGENFTLSVLRDRKPLTLEGKAERPAPRRTASSTV